MAEKEEVIFFIRAYNDLDIQLSLITAFALDDRFKVRVVFVHSDGFITHVKAHEAVDYIADQYKVEFSSVLDFDECPLWLRLLYFIKKKAFACRNRDFVDSVPPLALFFRFIDGGIGRLIRPALEQNPEWLKSVVEKWSPRFIFSDEVMFQYGRSPFIDYAVPALVEKGADAYAVLTGHRVYMAVNPTGQKRSVAYRPSKAKRFLVPSAHNKAIYSQLFPEENITVSGNLRFDRSWVELLHEKVFPEQAGLPERPVKIVMMLSKLDYGVRVDEIKDTIRKLGSMKNVALAIKPHTRAMKFDFMSKEEIGDAIIVDKIPSTSLIEWADITLMTGSSIVFHTMIRGKIAGFMKYCQKLETIFDDGKACRSFEKLDDLVAFVEDMAQNGTTSRTEEQKSDFDSFVTHEIHGDVKDGLTSHHCKDMILTDAGMET